MVTIKINITCVQVTNIDPGISSVKLREIMEELFSECGGVSIHSLNWSRSGILSIVINVASNSDDINLKAERKHTCEFFCFNIRTFQLSCKNKSQIFCELGLIINHFRITSIFIWPIFWPVASILTQWPDQGYYIKLGAKAFIIGSSDKVGQYYLMVNRRAKPI